LNIFRQDVDNFNITNQKSNKDLQNKLLNNKSNFLKLIEPILLDYVAENNIKYLLQKKYIIIGHNDLNKTSDIIKLINNKINISNFNESIAK
jgi:Skp family chaperone for outer membrane proteins